MEQAPCLSCCSSCPVKHGEDLAQAGEEPKHLVRDGREANGDHCSVQRGRELWADRGASYCSGMFSSTGLQSCGCTHCSNTHSNTERQRIVSIIMNHSLTPVITASIAQTLTHVLRH